MSLYLHERLFTHLDVHKSTLRVKGDTHVASFKTIRGRLLPTVCPNLRKEVSLFLIWAIRIVRKLNISHLHMFLV